MTNADDKKEMRGLILAVEDDRTSLAILKGFLEDSGYDVIEAVNGRDALAVIERDAAALDVIVLDKMMPEMDGLEVVAHLKDDPSARHIPIIMVTGASKPEDVKEGVDAGVFYYLSKPYQDDMFESVVAAAMREAQRRKNLKTELSKHQTSFGFIDNANFTIRTLQAAEDLSCFIANCFPSPETALPGLAGLLVNAVEHGNLAIGYDLKTELHAKGTWQEEIEMRTHSEDYVDKVVKVHLAQTDADIRVTIIDEGKGFEWQKFMDIDPARALDNHGRGIAQANKISFDELIYNDKGNTVTAISYKGSGIKW